MKDLGDDGRRQRPAELADSQMPSLASRAMGQEVSSAAAGDGGFAVKGAADAAQVS